jgi:hypothetical protein
MLFGGQDLPSSNRHEHYKELIDRLSDADSPTIFSLPENIERSVQRATSSKVRTSMCASQHLALEATARQIEAAAVAVSPAKRPMALPTFISRYHPPLSH